MLLSAALGNQLLQTHITNLQVWRHLQGFGSWKDSGAVHKHSHESYNNQDWPKNASCEGKGILDTRKLKQRVHKNQEVTASKPECWGLAAKQVSLQVLSHLSCSVTHELKVIWKWLKKWTWFCCYNIILIKRERDLFSLWVLLAITDCFRCLGFFDFAILSCRKQGMKISELHTISSNTQGGMFVFFNT